MVVDLWSCLVLLVYTCIALRFRFLICCSGCLVVFVFALWGFVLFLWVLCNSVALLLIIFYWWFLICFYFLLICVSVNYCCV